MLKSIRFLIVIYIGRIDWTDFVSLRRPCAHRLNGDRDTLVSLSLVVKPASRRFELHAIAFKTQKNRHKGGHLLVGLTGLEPATSSTRTKRSTRLNYNPFVSQLAY